MTTEKTENVVEEETKNIEETENSNIISRSDLIELLAIRCNFTKSEATRAVNSCVDIIQENIKEGVEVQIHKFVTFTPAIQKAFTGRNPRTGESVDVEEKRTVRCKVSKVFKNYINDDTEEIVGQQ